MHCQLLRSLRKFAFAALILATPGFLDAETQTFKLAAFWNMISFQITPDNPDPEAVFSTLPGFQSAWTYDTDAALWRQYVKPAGVQSDNQEIANRLSAMPPISPGQAYWVFVSQRVSAWEVTGTVPQDSEFPGIELKEGWNLFGIPVGATAVETQEPVNLLQVLATAGLDYDALMTWESQSFRKMFRPQADPDADPPHPLSGLPPDAPLPLFDLQNDLGRGYWIHVTDPAILRPRLVTTVRPDIDAEPFDNFPSKEDVNVSGFLAAATPKSVQEQDVIRFFPGEDVQTLGISNLGDANGGGGILIWEAEWIPDTDTGTPESWIRLFTSPAQREERDQDGQLLSPHTRLTGVTTLENDIVYLRLDRKNLGRGLHEGTLHLRTSVGDRAYKVAVEVGGLEGDFKGYAVIQSVNGKRNPVPDIDLVVSFYEDNKVDGLLRGTIDSSQALLWPVDVPLVGYRVANEGNQFVLGGSFVLPPGDQNGEPYDRFDEADPAAGVDVDWLNNGTLDVTNPFPFPVQRTVSFEGALTQANPTDGYILEGDYSEIVHGMSREPIVLSGTFYLERQAARPFSTRRSVTEDTGIEPVITVKNSNQVSIPVGATRTSAVSVITEMELQSLQVSLGFNSPLDHSSLMITLRSPGPDSQELILYDGGTADTSINPKLLESITFPLDRPMQGDLGQFLRNIERTRTDSSQTRFWEIEITNSGNQSVSLASWSLRLEGQPVTDVTGLVKDGETPVEGVTVAVTGLPISLSSGLTDAEGRFTLSRVPLLPLNFSALRPGYLPSDPASPGLSSLFTSPFVGQEGHSERENELINGFNPLAGAPALLAGTPGFDSGTVDSPFELGLQPETSESLTIAAGPLIASVGSTVDFYAVNPLPQMIWALGDGTLSSETVISHEYVEPGAYQVTLLSFGGGNEQNTEVVVVLPAPGRVPLTPAGLGGEPTGLDEQTDNALYTAYVFQHSFTMAGVIPAHKDGINPLTGADLYVSDITPKTTFTTGETNEFGAAFVSTMPLQHAYVASMDTDLAPRASASNTSKPFDLDGFAPVSSLGFDPSVNINEQGFKEEDFDYSHVAVLWQNTRTTDGSVEYTQDAQNGLIVWGNSLTVPNLNYSTENYQARDGADFNVAQDDEIFHAHTGTTTLTDLETHQEVTHYRMTCSMGPTILTIPTVTASVELAKLRRGQPDDPLSLELVAAAKPVSRNLHFQLQIGILDSE